MTRARKLQRLFRSAHGEVFAYQRAVGGVWLALLGARSTLTAEGRGDLAALAAGLAHHLEAPDCLAPEKLAQARVRARRTS